MNDHTRLRDGHGPRGGPAGLAATAVDTAVYAALDLGTNNCRLLIACPTGDGFRVVDSFSRIIRLGERLESIFANRTDRTVFLAADKSLPYATVVDVIDAWLGSPAAG